MNLSQLVTIIRSAWLSIVLMMVVGVGTAWIVASTLPKEYSAKARVMLNVENDDPNQYSQLKKNTEADYIGTQIRLVGDDGVTREVVQKLGWPDDPNVISSWEEATGGTGDIVKWAAQRLAPNVSAHQFEDSAIVEIYYTASSVDVAKSVVALIRTAYINNSLRLRAEAARKAATWNRAQSARALAALQREEAERSAFVKANNIPIDTSSDSLEMRTLSTTTRESVPGESAFTEPVVSLPMRALKKRLEMLESEIAVMDQQLGADNPVTISKTAQRDEVRTQLARETAFAQAGANATESQINANRQLRSNSYLQARLAVLDRVPLYDRLAAIDREIALKTKLYLAAEQRVKNFDTIAAAPSGIHVIGDIIADDDPVFPNVLLSVGLAALLSLGLGIASALFGEMLRRPIRGAEDLRFYGKVPVLAVIRSGPAPRKWFRGMWLGRRRRLAG